MKLNQRRCFIFALAALLLRVTAAYGDPVINPSPIVPPLPTNISTRAIHGWVRAHGTELSDNLGPVVLRGVNASGMEYGTGSPDELTDGKWEPGYEPYAASMFDNLAKWGFNVVRVPISWANIEPVAPTGEGGLRRHIYNETYLEEIDKVIASARDAHLAVILSMHQWGWSPYFSIRNAAGENVRTCGMPWWLYEGGDTDATAARWQFFTNAAGVQNDFAAVWKVVADRYADNKTVIGADMFNEPSLDPTYGKKKYKGGDVAVDSLYSKVGSVIRSVNPHIVLVYESSATTPLVAAPSLDNVVYSMHLYPKTWPGDGVASLKSAIKLCGKWNIPLWIGEFQTIGKPTGDPGPEGWHAQTYAMLQFCKENNINWSYWAYQKAARPLIADDDAAPDMKTVEVLQSGL